MIHVYITHHVTSAVEHLNDILIDQIYRMRPETSYVNAWTKVVYWTDDHKYTDELRNRLPAGVELIFNDRSGRPDTQPSMRNKVIDHARSSGCEGYVLVHNDVRFARGSLDHLVADWRKAEARHGRNRVIVSPRYIPYHVSEPFSEAVARPDFWRQLRANAAVKTIDQMTAWCAQWGWRLGEDREVVCPKQSSTTDDGHQLMMFVAGSRFFDDVGPCDENFTGVNFDDSDWGIRALKCGKRNLQSTGALLGHIGGLTFGPVITTPAWLNKSSDNERVFIKKWGRSMYDEMQTGQLWIRLHREQGSEGEVRS